MERFPTETGASLIGSGESKTGRNLPAYIYLNYIIRSIIVVWSVRVSVVVVVVIVVELAVEPPRIKGVRSSL